MEYFEYEDFVLLRLDPQAFTPSSRTFNVLLRLPFSGNDMNFYLFINRIGPKVAFIMLFFPTTIFSQPKITIPDITPRTIEQLHAFLKSNPDGFTVDVVPQKKWLETMTGFITAPFTRIRNVFSLKNVSLTLLSGALSLGWISYVLCAYVIYKTCIVMKNVHSWVNWCSNDDLLSDYDALYRKIAYHKRSRSRTTKKSNLTLMTLQQEKELLTTYVRLDAFLRTHNLRHYFPHADARTHRHIKHAYKKLQKAEELLMLRKQRMHFARNL